MKVPTKNARFPFKDTKEVFIQKAMTSNGNAISDVDKNLFDEHLGNGHKEKKEKVLKILEDLKTTRHT